MNVGVAPSPESLRPLPVHFPSGVATRNPPAAPCAGNRVRLEKCFGVRREPVEQQHEWDRAPCPRRPFGAASP